MGTDLTVVRNDGGTGAALFLRNQSMDCTNCDFGAGVDDNRPLDGFASGTAYSSLGLNFVL